MVKFFHRIVTIFYIELDSREMKRTLQVLNLLLFFSVAIGMQQHNDYNVNLHFPITIYLQRFLEIFKFQILQHFKKYFNDNIQWVKKF